MSNRTTPTPTPEETALMESIRESIRAESVSMFEIAQLQALGDDGLIPEHDIELRQWAGIPELAWSAEADRKAT